MKHSLVCSILLILVHATFAADDVTITPDVVYGHKDGLAMTWV